MKKCVTSIRHGIPLMRAERSPAGRDLFGFRFMSRSLLMVISGVAWRPQETNCSRSVVKGNDAVCPPSYSL